MSTPDHEAESPVVILGDLEEAFVGYVEGAGEQQHALYSTKSIIVSLMSGSDMSLDEAVEFFDYNIRVRFAPEGNPYFLMDMVDD
tara:strand:+ start:6254 stop:6508 length:255 start_codon:yes stop_codon:yes gene_type:complete